MSRYLHYLKPVFIVIVIVLMSLASTARAEEAIKEAEAALEEDAAPARESIKEAEEALEEDAERAKEKVREKKAKKTVRKKKAARVREKFDASGKFRMEVALAIGAGFDDLDVGWTTDGDTISLGAGGGLGFGLGLGYGLTSRLEAELKLGRQVSVMTPSVSNADGEFTRGMALGTLKFRKLISDRSNLKFGAGLGIYTNGEWDLDLSRLPGGSHIVVEYDNAIGAHATLEFERIFRGDWSLAVGGRMYFVEYEAATAYQNGISIPVGALSSELQQLDGSGFDFTLAFSQYF